MSEHVATLALTLLLGIIAAVANILGGMVLVRSTWAHRYLRYFVALGAGFMMATVLLEMVPESLRLSLRWGAVMVLGGFCLMHLFEHTLTPHFHFGEETHEEHFLSHHTGNSVLAALAAHTFFDGIAIGSGFALSRWLGWVIFLSVLLHKLPEGFTVASVMLASGRSRRTAVNSSVLLGLTTVAGVVLVGLLPRLVAVGLPISAGVTLYVAASDLVPEVNKEPGTRMALVFFLGVGVFLALRALGEF